MQRHTDNAPKMCLQRRAALFSLPNSSWSPRWYWAYRQMAELVRQLGAGIPAQRTTLTRKYRLGAAQLQNFSTLAQALAAMGTIRNWSVLEAGLLTRGRQYEGRLRLAAERGAITQTVAGQRDRLQRMGSRASDWKTVASSATRAGADSDTMKLLAILGVSLRLDPAVPAGHCQRQCRCAGQNTTGC